MLSMSFGKLAGKPGFRKVAVAAASLAALAAADAAQAQTLQYWDGANTTPGNVANGRGGGGIWDSTATNWTSQPGTANAAWGSGNVAVFANNPGPGVSFAVEVRGPQTVAGISILAGGRYNFQPGAGGAFVTGGPDFTIDVADPDNGVIDAAIAVPIQGAGRLVKTGAGSASLLTANAYTGGTFVQQGILQVRATGALGTGPVAIGGGARLTFRGAAAPAANGLAIGVQSNGTLYLFNNGSGGNATIDNTGFVVVDDDGTLGTAFVTNQAGGEVQFSGNGDGATATIVNRAGADVDISQADTGASIGILTGAGNVFLGSRTLTLGGLNQDMLITGAIADGGINGGTGGSLVKTGTGILVLAGVNSYTGATTVNGGTLLVNGSLTGAVTVANGATLGGTGSVGGTNVNGTLSPGGNGAIGTLTINGNLVFNAGSNFRVDVGAAAGISDRVLVTGTASLAGSLTAIASNGTFVRGSYILLTANGGLTGSFNPITTQPNAPVRVQNVGNDVILFVDAGVFTTTLSERQSIIFTAPVVTTNRVTNYSTQIIGRLLGGQPLYDQTFAAAFADPLVQNGLTAARAAITTAGGPGVIIGDPVRTASSTSSSTASASIFTLTNTQSTIEPGVVTFGPATLTVGALSTCNISSLPSGTRPTCQDGGTTLVLDFNDSNVNVNTNTVFTVAEARTDTITETLRETWELNGQVVAVGTIHAEVQSGLFDLGGRLLGRLGAVEAGSAGWGELYRFRVSQSGRRDAWGLAGGFGLAVAPGLTLAAGIDHGNLDIDVPGALETGTVELTEIGAALRFDRGPFTASLAAVHGFGKAETRRTIIGRSDAEYDVRLTGIGVELGYAIRMGGWTLRPGAGLDYVRLSTDGFTETDMLGLVVGKEHADRLRASAGLAIGRDFGGFSLSASARYLAILSGGQRRLPVAFALAPGNVLEMSGPGEPDGVLLGARLGVKLSPGAAFFFGYDGRFGGGYEAHGGTAGLRVTF